MMSSELARIRALFQPLAGSVYMDTATYGLPPLPTVACMSAALQGWQAGTAEWRTDWEEPADETRRHFAFLIGAREAEIARIPQSSVGTGLVAAGLTGGDEVVIPDDEFTSTLFPMLVAERRGTRIRQVPFDDLASAIRPETTLVATSLVQMQTGRVADISAICDRAEAVGARVLIDGTQAVPFFELESVIKRIDYLVCSAYKHLLCPRGVSFLYVNEARWGELQPLNAGWRAADRPFERYFGGPLTLAADAAKFDVSMGWIAWIGALTSLRLVAEWKAAGALAKVIDFSRLLAAQIGVSYQGSTLVCAPIADANAVRFRLKEAGIKASIRGDSVRFAPHLYNSSADMVTAGDAILAFVSRR